jgi:hypothetical protein
LSLCNGGDKKVHGFYTALKSAFACPKGVKEVLLAWRNSKNLLVDALNMGAWQSINLIKLHLI